MLTMYQQITIKTLKSQGKKNSEIAQLMNVHRNTVRNVLGREIMEKQTRNRPSSFSTYHSQIETLLGKGLTKLRVWEILEDEHQLNRSYSAFIKYCHDHIKKKKEAFGVQSPPPGEEAEVDFGYAGMFPAPTGELVKVWVFVMTLSYSRLGYYLAVTDQTVETFGLAHQQAFSYFGGVPKTVKVDNLKAAVIANGRYDLELNRTFLDFSLHYRFVITPCPPRNPHHKGKVERGVDYVKKNFLAGRSFTDTNDLNRQLKDWMVTTANQRLHGTTKRIPKELFDEVEKQYLQPLPDTNFTFTPSLTRTVNGNCHIQVNNSYYSVPAQYVGEVVEARINGNLLTIHFQDQVIATHPLTQGQGQYVTTRTHLPEDRVYSKTEYQAKYEAQFVAIGSDAHEFFRLLVKKTNMWVKTAKVVLGLATIYGPDKVNKACKRAVTYQAIRAGVVKRICEKNLENTELEPKLPKPNITAACPDVPIATAPAQNITPQPTLHRSLDYYRQTNRNTNTMVPFAGEINLNLDQEPDT